MKNLACLLLAVISPLTAACVDDTATLDGFDDAFLADGKADTGGITDGTPEAIAVLRVANERSRTQMEDHGVAPLAARNIVAVRGGDDTGSSADDVVFTSVAQLDAVPYVGPVAFARLLAYADELGYVTPMPTPAQPPANVWQVAACPRITFAQLVAKFSAGIRSYNFQRPYATASRHRNTCNPVTGCTPWQNGGVELFIESIPNWSFPMPGATRGTTEMQLQLNPNLIYLMLKNPMAEWERDVWFFCGNLDESNVAALRCQVLEQYGARGIGFAPEDKQVLDGRICADGSYHFTSAVLGDQSDAPANLNQIALYGQLF